jgi:hypothetical protein
VARPWDGITWAAFGARIIGSPATEFTEAAEMKYAANSTS